MTTDEILALRARLAGLLRDDRLLGRLSTISVRTEDYIALCDEALAAKWALNEARNADRKG